MNGIPNKAIQNRKICFAKSGTSPRNRATNKSDNFFLANDWTVVVDANKQYAFPIQVALTALYPDI